MYHFIHYQRSYYLALYTCRHKIFKQNLTNQESGRSKISEAVHKPLKLGRSHFFFIEARFCLKARLADANFVRQFLKFPMQTLASISSNFYDSQKYVTCLLISLQPDSCLEFLKTSCRLTKLTCVKLAQFLWKVSKNLPHSVELACNILYLSSAFSAMMSQDPTQFDFIH